MPGSSPILIAGAGIGGLTLAIALRARGLPVRLLERAASLEAVGAGVQLSPNAGRVLEALGLGPALDEHAVRPEAVRMLDGLGGGEIAHVPLAAAAEARWGVPYRVMYRADLQRVLAEAARARGAELELATEIEAVRSAESGSVRIVHSRGEAEGAAVVGADGLHSTLRRSLGHDEPPRRSGMVAWRALAPAAALPPDLRGRDTNLWMGPGAHLVAYPVRGGEEINLVAVIPGAAETVGWSTLGDRMLLHCTFASWAPAVRALLAAAQEWRIWPLLDRPPDRLWGKGALTLLGDAAHPMLPHLAQGGAMAIEDAAVLALELAARPENPVLAFRRYERGRQPRTARAQRAARRNGRIYTLGGALAKARDAALRLAGPDRLAARMDWLYGWPA